MSAASNDRSHGTLALTARQLSLGAPVGHGFALTAISMSDGIDLTFTRPEQTFRIWLKPAWADTGCYRATTQFKIGYQDSLDADGRQILEAICQLAELDPGGIRDLTLSAAMPNDATAVRSAHFTPLYLEWSTTREQRLAQRLEQVDCPRRRRILLVNATEGLQYFGTVGDFFAAVQRHHPSVECTSASYFPMVHEFHAGIAAKGLRVVAPEELMTWGADRLNHFDVALFIGPSDAMFRIMNLAGVRTRLLMLDLGAYHRLIELTPEAMIGPQRPLSWRRIRLKTAWQRWRSPQRHTVIAYACQPEQKLAWDLVRGGGALRYVQWRWLNYIPLGFRYCAEKYCASDRKLFDIAFMGAFGRDYSQVDPDQFRGRRILFLGKFEPSPDLERLRRELDITVVPRVYEETYFRLLATCRCMIVPLPEQVHNVLLSVVDAIAAGIPLIIRRHPGMARLEAEGVPAVFYDGSAADLGRTVNALLNDSAAQDRIAEQSTTFAREKLDFYDVLWRIFEEEIL